ncbi:ABC transporter permease [Rhodobacteraceae bacterium Araon29]
MNRETVRRWRYKLIPDHVIGEILTKRWTDNAIPFVTLLALIICLQLAIPNFFTAYAITDYSRQIAELGLVVLAMTIVMIGGGIDLSVGSIFAVGNFTALYCVHIFGMHPLPTFCLTCLAGILCGAFNGYFIGYLRLRAFLTTLVSLIIFRSIVDLLLQKHAVGIMAIFPDSNLWFAIGEDDVWNIPYTFIATGLIALFLHIGISRMRPGWHLMAVGGARRSAHNAGVNVKRTVFLTYVTSGLLCAIAAFMFASRLSSASSDAGNGMEIMALTAAVLGGTSLGGGRGSVAKAIFGAIIVLLLSNGLIRLGIQGGASSLIFGVILMLAVLIDVRWLKNRGKILSKVYVSPTYMRLFPAPSTSAKSDSPYAENNKLHHVDIIGLGKIEGPEDVILDEDDNLYAGTRQGDIAKFLAPDYKEMVTFAHIGGRPLGMAFDANGNLITCVASMGVYSVSPLGSVSKITDQTNRSWTSVVDDSRLNLADDLDIAPDGKIYFSEATKRFDTHTWAVDCLESRGNGRIVCHDPKTNKTKTIVSNLIFPNGICTSHDGQSILFAESWACRISRYWINGPKNGSVEPVIPNLPGYPDNINRASDGTYWLALLGMRGPALDLAQTMPSFRKRMARRVSDDSWLFPNINTGCVLKFDENGEVLDALWDLGGVNHPMLSSMREHKGYLYLGGVSNNRIGKYKIPDSDQDWTGSKSYWGNLS